jgi:hypothetical protein
MKFTLPNLPKAFCWTRIGIDAGECLQSIFQRKEQERLATGMFFWGIGNSVGGDIGELRRQDSQPEVIFSPIKSPPRPADSNPPSTVVWKTAKDLDGNSFEIPQGICIVSSSSRLRYYALVCSSDTPLTTECAFGTVNVGDLENLRSGRQVGSSQVTAVVRQCSERRSGIDRDYPVVVRAKLVAPYFLYLADPVQRNSASCANGSNTEFCGAI